MADDTTPPDGPARESAVVLGRLAFTRLREEAAARATAQRLARAQRKNAVQKRLMMRVLNKDKKKPDLQIIK